MKNATFRITPIDNPRTAKYFDLTVQSVVPVEGVVPGKYTTIEQVIGAFDWPLKKEKEDGIRQSLSLFIPVEMEFKDAFDPELL